MRLYRVLIVLLFILLSISLHARSGYRITLQIENDSTRIPKEKATLWRCHWDGDKLLDSASFDKKARFYFRGEKNLERGEYIIKYAGSNIEFFSSGKRYLSENIKLKNGRLIHIKGSKENALFSSFQNLVNYGWRELGSVRELQEKIDSISAEAHKIEDGLFDNMLDALDFAQGDGNSGWLDEKGIINTRFGNSAIEKYFKEIEYNSSDSVTYLIEKLIDAADENLGPYIAYGAFSHFRDPGVMGQESIACHFAENYFLNKRYPASEAKIFEMNTYLMLNKNCLAGMVAQELVMEDTSGKAISLHNTIIQGEYTIIYFYTDDCSTCRLETPALADFINGYSNGVVNVYAVYTQSNKERWLKYIEENFYITNPFVNWINVWDPEVESGFHLNYNVISTPQIYLIDKCGRIIGRGLGSKSLKELIEATDGITKMTIEFLSDYFNNAKEDGYDGVIKGIDLLYEYTKGDLKSFRELFSQIYILLKNSADHNLKEAALYLAERYILGKGEVWEMEAYLEKVENEVEMMKLAQPGEMAPSVEVVASDGNVSDIHSTPYAPFKAVLFYRNGCNECKIVEEGLKSLMGKFAENGKEEPTMQIYLADAGQENGALYRRFYLPDLPAIYLLDSTGRIIARNISVPEIEKLVNFKPDNNI